MTDSAQPQAPGQAEAHRYVLAPRAEGGAFWGRCRLCGAERTWPQWPETLSIAYQRKGWRASQKARRG